MRNQNRHFHREYQQRNIPLSGPTYGLIVHQICDSSRLKHTHTVVRVHLSNSSSVTEASTFSTLLLRLISTVVSSNFSLYPAPSNIRKYLSYIENTHNSSLAEASFSSFDEFSLNLNSFFRCRILFFVVTEHFYKTST